MFSQDIIGPPDDYELDNVEVVIPAVENIIEINGPQKYKEDLYSEKIDWRDSGIELYDEFTPFNEDDPNKKCGFIAFEGLTLEACNGAGIVIRNARAFKQ